MNDSRNSAAVDMRISITYVTGSLAEKSDFNEILSYYAKHQ